MLSALRDSSPDLRTDIPDRWIAAGPDVPNSIVCLPVPAFSSS